ncbi:hypothetical protein Btru_042701 [Bulinus truncatus]|nr:hypothetical protein Btru_042701 [Bulinus truncatus]
MTGVVLVAVYYMLTSGTYGQTTTNTFVEMCTNTSYVMPVDSSFIFRVKNYPRNIHRHNETCVLVLKTESEPLVIRMNFTDFMMTGGPLCRTKWLCVKGFKFCSTGLRRKTVNFIIPSNSNFTIILQHELFPNAASALVRATVTTESAIGKTVSVPQPRRDYDYRYIYYANITDNPETVYVDWCIEYLPTNG